MPRSRSRSEDAVEMIKIGVVLWASLFLMNEISSRPLMSGMLMSVTTRSHAPRGNRRSASNPLWASTTSSSPKAADDVSAALTKARMLAESSTSSTRRIEGQHTIACHFQRFLWQAAPLVGPTAVIGAGSSGLTVLKALLEAGVPAVCFERGSRVGGNWVFD